MNQYNTPLDETEYPVYGIFGKNPMMKVKLYNIEYETDGEVVTQPKEITTTLQEMGWSEYDLSPAAYIDECGADYISDVTGWLVKSFKYTIETKQ